MLEKKRFLTTEEVATLLRTSPRTVARWAKEGRLPAVRIGKQWLFPAEELEALLRAKREEKDADTGR